MIPGRSREERRVKKTKKPDELHFLERKGREKQGMAGAGSWQVVSAGRE